MRGDSHQIWQPLVMVIGITLICSFQSKGIEVCPENGILHFNCTHTSFTGIFFEKTNCTRATRNQSGCNGLFRDMRKCFFHEECAIRAQGHVCVHYGCKPKLAEVRSARNLKNANYSSNGLLWLHHVRKSNETNYDIKCSLDIRGTGSKAQVIAFYLAPFTKKNDTCLTASTRWENQTLCSGSGEISQSKTLQLYENSMDMSLTDTGTNNLDFDVLIYVYRNHYIDSHLSCTKSGSKDRPPKTDSRQSEGHLSTAIPQGTTRETTHHAMSTTTEHPPDGEIPLKSIPTVHQTATCTDGTANEATRQNFLVPVGISVAAVFLIASVVILVLIVRMAMKGRKTQPAPLNENIYCTPDECDTAVYIGQNRQRDGPEDQAIREMYSQPERHPKSNIQKPEPVYENHQIRGQASVHENGDAFKSSPEMLQEGSHDFYSQPDVYCMKVIDNDIYST